MFYSQSAIIVFNLFVLFLNKLRTTLNFGLMRLFVFI